MDRLKIVERILRYFWVLRIPAVLVCALLLSLFTVHSVCVNKPDQATMIAVLVFALIMTVAFFFISERYRKREEVPD